MLNELLAYEGEVYGSVPGTIVYEVLTSITVEANKNFNRS